MLCQVDPPYVHKQMVHAYYQSPDLWRTECCSRVFLAMIPEKNALFSLAYDGKPTRCANHIYGTPLQHFQAYSVRILLRYPLLGGW